MAYNLMSSVLPPGKITGNADSPISRLNALEERERWLSDHFHALSQYLLVEQEEERRKLSRILHDKVGQSLTAAIINLQTAQLSGENVDPDMLHLTCQTLSDCLNEVREMSLNLRPSQLDELGLVLAIEAYLQRVLGTEVQNCEFKAIDLEDRLPPQLETTAFRIIQDLIAICRRNFEEFSLKIILRVEQDSLHIELGYQATKPEDKAPNIDHKQFLGIRERTAMLMGESVFLVDEGRGQINICLPVSA